MSATSQMIPAIKSDRAGRPWVEFGGDGFYSVYVSECAFALPLWYVGCINHSHTIDLWWKFFPPKFKTVNMIYVTHIPKRKRKCALRDIYAVEPVAPKFNPWSACPITFDRRDHPTSIRHGGSAALVLDPIIDGYHLTRVLMVGGCSLNLIYQDTVH